MYNGIKMAKKITYDCGKKSIDSIVLWMCFKPVQICELDKKKMTLQFESNCIQACVANEKKSTRSSALWK